MFRLPPDALSLLEDVKAGVLLYRPVSDRRKQLCDRLEQFNLIKLEDDRYFLTVMGMEHIDHQYTKRRRR